MAERLVGKRAQLWVLGLALPSILSCSSDRIHRSDLDAWSTITDRVAGIAYEMPKNHSHHQLHWSSSGIGDAFWYLRVSFEAKPRAEFDDPSLPSSESPLSRDEEYMSWFRWVTRFHPGPSCRQVGTWQKQCRRDVTTAQDMVGSLHITYSYRGFSEEEIDADERAIRRILDSLRVL